MSSTLRKKIVRGRCCVGVSIPLIPTSSWGRVDLGGRPPRPPTNPDVPVKGIRLVTLWRCPSHDPTASGDTRMRHGVLGVVSTSGPQRGTPFAPRGPVGPVPPLRRYYGALRLLAVHLAALRFLRLAIITVSSPIRPHRLGTGAVDQPGVGKPGSKPAVNDEDGKVSHVPVKPV